MKIQELHLKNFSSHADSDIYFEKQMALIVGNLGAGKSSVLQAIEYALTGECGYHRKRTDNKSEIVRGSGKFGSMDVRLVTDAGSAERIRNVQDNVETCEWDGMTQQTAAAMAASVASATRCSTTMLSSLLNTSGFFSLDESEQKEIIIGLIGAVVTDEKILSAWEGEKDALKCLPKSPLTSVKALDNAYDYVFKRRTVAKRELEDLKPPAPPEGPQPPIDKLRTRMEILEKELQDALIAKARLEGAASAVSGRDELQEEANQLRADMQVALVKPDAAIQAIKDQEKRIQEFSKVVAAIDAEVVDIRVKIGTARANIALLTKFDGRCVAGDHKCPAPMSDMKTALVQQQTALESIEGDLKSVLARQVTAQSARDDRSEIKRHEVFIEACLRASELRKRQEDRLGFVELALAKKEIVADTAEIDKLQGVADSLNERIAAGRKMITAATSWIERDRAIKAVAEKRKVLETEVRYLAELCTFLGPNGVRVQLIDEKIGAFVDQIQSRLNSFGFNLELTVDPWTITVNGTPIKRLSASERYRLSVCFQCAIALVSGVGFVVIDGSEILTPSAMGAMMNMLSSAGLDQAIVIRTLMTPLEDFIKKPPQIPGLECFVITNTDGISTVLKLD